jgi:hypothetical protein
VVSLRGLRTLLLWPMYTHTTQAGNAVSRTLLFHTFILVKALSLGHTLTTIPPIQCVPMEISISALTPLTFLGSNG